MLYILPFHIPRAAIFRALGAVCYNMENLIRAKLGLKKKVK